MQTTQMKSLSLISVFLVGFMMLSVPLMAAETKLVAKPASKEIINDLTKGGFVIYMRHGPTDTSKPDRVPDVDLEDCTTQRPLTEEGRAVSAGVGNAIRKAGIPVGEIIVSPMCRTKETAQAAFGTDFSVNLNLRYSSNFTSDKKLVASKTTLELISRVVKPGTNRVLVAHGPNLMDLMGYFVKPEATVVIFRPMGDKRFEYIASIPPTMWPELLK